MCFPIYRLGQARQPIAAHDQHVLDAPIGQLSAHSLLWKYCSARLPCAMRVSLFLLEERGRLIDLAGRDEKGCKQGGMVALAANETKTKILIEKVCSLEKLTENHILEAVNFNGLRQTIVAGDLDSLSKFMEIASKEKVRVKKLKVGSAFHSSMMYSAIPKFQRILSKTEFYQPEKRVYCNIRRQIGRASCRERV